MIRVVLVFLIGLPPWGKRALVALAVGVVVLIFLFFAIGDRDKSYSAHAQTRGLDIVFNEQPISAWQLENMLVCFRRDRTDAEELEDGTSVSPLCDAERYRVARFHNQEFTWPRLTHLQITRVSVAAALEIDIVDAGETPLIFGGSEVPDRSRLIVPATAWAGAGTLPLEGRITIGDTPSSGSQLNVISGKYAVSERLAWYNKPVEIVSGDLRSGDVVRMIDSAETGDVFGFIEPAGKDEAGFLVTIFSALGGSRLQLYRYGVIDLQIEPSLIDRSLHNPVLLALGVLLAILAGIASAIQLVRWIIYGSGKAP